jgi:hypothetical protein
MWMGKGGFRTRVYKEGGFRTRPYRTIATYIRNRLRAATLYRATELFLKKSIRNNSLLFNVRGAAQWGL